jgi:NADH:ubiquinone oxidoreductase subunit E
MNPDTEREVELVRAALSASAPTQDQLLPVLLDVQRRIGYVPKAAIDAIAKHFNLSRAEVHGVATFYHDLHEAPLGRHVVQICQAEACQAVGCRELAEHAQQRLGIAMGATTPDGLVTIEAAYCFGNCACGPTVRIGDDVHGRVTAERFDELITALNGGRR